MKLDKPLEYLSQKGIILSEKELSFSAKVGLFLGYILIKILPDKYIESIRNFIFKLLKKKGYIQ